MNEWDKPGRKKMKKKTFFDRKIKDKHEEGWYVANPQTNIMNMHPRILGLRSMISGSLQVLSFRGHSEFLQ